MLNPPVKERQHQEARDAQVDRPRKMMAVHLPLEAFGHHHRSGEDLSPLDAVMRAMVHVMTAGPAKQVAARVELLRGRSNEKTLARI